MRPSHIAFALVAVTLSASATRAQELRTLEAARQLSDSSPTQVEVTFGAGKFKLHPITGNLLYQMRLRYDERATDAVHEYDAESRSLTLGLDRGSAKFGFGALRHGGNDKGSELDIGLNGAVPMELSVKVAGTESTLQLGGLRLTDLEVNCAATGATIDFASPNAVEMGTFTLQIAAAGAKIQNLGNANTSTLSLQGAAGGVEIDFGPTLMRDVTIRAEVAVGGMQITLPRDVGIMVESKSRLGSFDAAGLKKVGNAWYSENWNEATHKVTIESTTFLSSFELSRTSR